MPTPARLRAGTSPAPTPPAKPLYGASAAPPCGAPEVKKKMPSFLVQLENRHRSVKQTCRWHVCSVGRSGYGARRELCGCLLFVQFRHRHRSVKQTCRWHVCSVGRSGYAARGNFADAYSSSNLSTAMNASVGICTVPSERIFFLPSFCFSSSFFFRVMSPP